jgi:hypothetical protein
MTQSDSALFLKNHQLNHTRGRALNCKDDDFADPRPMAVIPTDVKDLSGRISPCGRNDLSFWREKTF